jgi:hypothetical protein
MMSGGYLANLVDRALGQTADGAGGGGGEVAPRAASHYEPTVRQGVVELDSEAPARSDHDPSPVAAPLRERSGENESWQAIASRGEMTTAAEEPLLIGPVAAASPRVPSLQRIATSAVADAGNRLIGPPAEPQNLKLSQEVPSSRPVPAPAENVHHPYARLDRQRNVRRPPTVSAAEPRRANGPLKETVAAGLDRHVENDSLAAERDVYVTIGRVDVRAIFPSPPPHQPRKTSSPPAPRLSLDDYMRGTGTGGGGGR